MAQYELNQIAHDPLVEAALAKLQAKLAEKVNTTVEGNRLTILWNERGHLIQVACVILSIDDGREEAEPEVEGSVEV